MTYSVEGMRPAKEKIVEPVVEPAGMEINLYPYLLWVVNTCGGP